MYRTMKSCFCSIFQAVPGKAMRYMGCKAIAAILFPANVVLVERCISSMEGAFYREFWLTFPAFLLCAFVLVVTEHCGRVADMEFTQGIHGRIHAESDSQADRHPLWLFRG